MRALAVVSAVPELKDVWHDLTARVDVAPDAGSCAEIAGNQDVLAEELQLV